MKNNSSSENRRAGALKRLGVTEEQVRSAPNLSSLLKQGKGGLGNALQAMRFSANSAVLEFLNKYDILPERDRQALPWEAIALSADVDVNALLGAAIFAIQSYSANAVKIIALSHHPEIMSNRVKFARLPGGERDRAAVDTGLGFLPTKTGSTFIINPGSVQAALPNPKEKDDEDNGDDEEEDDEVNRLFPALALTQETLVPLRARMLEDGR